MRKIGFIGLGNIGFVLAGHLVRAGYPVTVHDLRHEAAEELLASGAEWADTPRAVSEVSDTVITSLPGPPQVKKVAEGENGLIAGLRPGCTWIDMSTTNTKEVQRLGRMAEEKGVSCLEAPVTGGLALAKEGGITILVGGKKDVFDDHLEILQVMGGKVLYMGPLGSESVVKVISNLLALGHLILAGEAFLLGKRAGIDLSALFDGIRASSGNSYTIETEMPLVFNGTYDVGFSLALACKDLNLAYQLGREFAVPLEMGSLIEQIFQRARLQYGDETNSTQAVKLLEDALGDYLRADGYDPAIPLDE
jgi:3-hydroxyisobutyrate dehydrogenase